ncbi:hybrid sensor histidine kinase/response regulator, partial [bacterium]|nr:hybrid sensor histidine kinase/response regulator [bacterium]
AESEEIIERLNNTLLSLEKSPTDKDLIVLIFRDAHSLKGAARMIGFTTIQNIAHKIEDILGLAKDNQLKLTSEIADTMYKSVDLISKIIEQSIETGVEKFDSKEVQTQVELLENIQNQKSEIVIEENKQTEVFNPAELAKNIDRINYLVINTLIYIIKITEKIEQEFIIKILENVTELVKYFQIINYFEIKEELENIRTKLEVVVKCNTELSMKEVEDIQRTADKILTELTNLCKNNGIATVDYYGYAFEGKDYKTAPKYCFEDINENLKKNESTEEVIKILKELKNTFKQEKLVSLSDKIIDLLEFTKKINTKPDEAQTEIISTALKYCFACVNDENPSDDPALLEQQLTVAKQLIEISNPVVSVETPVRELSVSKNNITKKVKDFSKLLNTGEIKTLHVESSKLDAMVSQIGELISTKIKTTKQLSQLSIIEKNFEECQKELSKILHHVKLYDKKFSHSMDNSSNIHLKQFINSFAEQNKKLNLIINEFNKLQRSNIEDDMKMRILIDDFDAMVKNIRILPLATVFHLFGRMVRDIAKERGKEVELIITGSETSADKKIIEEIKNPLIHIIRNSIDHGIETPEQRIKSGKSPVGHLQINAKHLDSRILIEVIDDGQGFNVQKIKDKALQNGFLTKEELELMNDDEIINIVFLPGFTTGEEVTSISGRGIGMDVVKSKIAQLNGTVKVISEFNLGSKIQIELPVTMATMSAFLIQASNQTFAVPMSVINTVVCKKEDEILNNHETKTILLNGRNIPVFYLSNILNLPVLEDKNTFKTILIIETNNKTIGIIVDKLLGEQEILHKKLSPPIYKIKNISGITTLASGETCLILNIIDIMKSTTFHNSKIASVKPKIIVDKKTLMSYKKILVVDDSITTRTLEKSILSNAGFNVETAIDPVDAMKKINQTKFDIILSDIEMPEMTGLELLAQLKTN